MMQILGLATNDVTIEISVRKQCSGVSMKQIKAGEDRFYDEIEALLKTKPELKNDDTAFAWWIIRFLTGDMHTADESVSGRKDDKNIDAIWLDDKRQIVNILQAKFRKKQARESGHSDRRLKFECKLP